MTDGCCRHQHPSVIYLFFPTRFPDKCCMFTGTYHHVLDDKGRLAIPAKFRALVADGMYVTRGTDHCLYVYSTQTWNGIVEKIRTLPLGDPNARNLRRSIAGAAEAVEID